MLGKVRSPSAVCLIAVCLLCGLTACSESSPTRELEHDASRDTIAGPRPTAPPSTDYKGPGLSSEGNQLLKELRGFQQQDDLCEVLSSKTIRSLLGGDVEVTGLVTTPSGVAQVLITLDSLFEHLVVISPPAVKPSMATVQETWKKLSAVEADALDREARIEAILSAPEVGAALQNITSWTSQNCLGQPALPFDLGGLLGGSPG